MKPVFEVRTHIAALPFMWLREQGLSWVDIAYGFGVTEQQARKMAGLT